MTTDQRHGPEELKAAIGELLTATDRLALCLDFDGTLAPIVDDPDEAGMPDETRDHVQTLAEHPAVDVAVISGRALEDVRSRAGIDGISYAGNHGLELQRGEEVWIHPDVETHRPALEKALDRIRQELSGVPGTSVEDKHASATIHYRRANTEDSGFVIAAVEETVENEDGVSMTVDNQTVEIRPDIPQRKGEAVRELIDVQSGMGIVYLGDAQTDVDAFETLAAVPNETVEISVGDTLPAKGYHLDSPAAVQRVLAWLSDEIDTNSGH